ncbi:hypothetical protein OCH7691_01621 [Oceanibacterium hippocampi]|uniref:Membrane dipeptidase (Peptidase family M19) n=1 Tax=Oceanibacterium hippocampi TaxID=745714 RepID=A0A1Y5SEH7_9PROT|nr:hypothetical protein OCH7691_01621 [Oceanibacterium hippocampi]
MEALEAEGFSRDEIAGILGANYLARVTMP